MTVTAWHLDLGWLVWCASSILVPLLLKELLHMLIEDVLELGLQKVNFSV